MAIILHIDTSGSKGLVALAEDGVVIKSAWNNEAMQHASFVQPAIQKIMLETGITSNELAAVAVSNGPGSYTGLRVGLASAKGLCFGWSKPLILVSTLKVLALSIRREVSGMEIANSGDNDGGNMHGINYKKTLPIVYCPMIDARRMEVFFALYDENMQQLCKPAAAIVDEYFLQDYVDSHQVLAVGNGAAKWKNIAAATSVTISTEPLQDLALCALSYQKYRMSDFDHLVDAVPFYAKEFYHPPLSSKK